MADFKPQGRINGDSIEVAVREEEVAAEIQCAGDHDTSGASQEDASKTAERADSVTVKVTSSNEDVVMLDDGLRIAPEPSDEPPGGLRANPVTPLKMGTGHVDELSALTPLPSPFISRPMAQGTNSDAKDGVAQLTSSPPSLTHDNSRFPSDSDQSLPHTVTSSPLSSPPTFLYDPYQQSSRMASASPSLSSSQDSSSASDTSSSSTPVFASQSSFASFAGRNSLPNMKGKDLFDAQIWSCPKQTAVFYTFITSLRQKVREAEPTSTHRFVSILRDSRKLVRCYTQNIDQLEERVGLSTSLELGPGSRYRFSARSGRTSGGPRGTLKETEPSSLSQLDSAEDNNDTPSGTQVEADSQTTVPVADADTKDQPSSQSEVPLSQASATTVKPPPNRGVECVCVHGSLAQLRCFVCGRTASWDEESRESDTLAGRQPQCPHCEKATAAREERGKRALGIGKLRPDIVLYGEAHPQDHLIDQVVRHDLSLGPDMLLILGTSLRVHGLKTLVREFAKTVHDRGGKVVFVNFTKPPDSVWSDFIDYWVQWDCDAWVSDIEKRKPALWLPPGTVLPEDEKTKKAPKAPRKSNVGEASKAAKDDSAGSKARRATTAGTGKRGRPRKEASSITVSGSQEEAEMGARLEIEVAGSAPSENQQGQQPLPSESVSTEAVIVAAEVTVEVGAPGKPVVESEEAVVANTSPSSDSPPGPGSSRLPNENHHPPRQQNQGQPTPDGPSSLSSPTAGRPEEPSPAAPQDDKRSPGPSPAAKDASPTSALVASPTFAQSTHSPPFTTSSERHGALPEQQQFAVGEMPPPPLPFSRSKKKAQPKTPKDSKLITDAKRPSAVRDDKRNAAWLTWKIAQDLRRITGREPLTLPNSSPAMPPRAKKSNKARKSAPAVLGPLSPTPTPATTGFVATTDAASTNPYYEIQQQRIAQERQQQLQQAADNDVDTEMHNHEDLSTFPADAPPAPTGINSIEFHDPESSISALVKSRKRKRKTWKLVNGVEVLVGVDAEEPVAAENPAPRRVSKQPRARKAASEVIREPAPAVAHEKPDPVVSEPHNPSPILVDSRDATPILVPSRTSSAEVAVISETANLPEPAPMAKPMPQVTRLPPGETMKKRMTLPPAFAPSAPVAVEGSWPYGEPAFEDGFSSTDRLIAKLNSELESVNNPQGHTNWGNTTPSTGFSETDRLIALASRPTSPGFRVNPQLHLPPLLQDHQPQPSARHANIQGHVENGLGTLMYSPSMPAVNLAQRLQPLEPKVVTPGPMVEIAPSVGSPPPHSPTDCNIGGTAYMNNYMSTDAGGRYGEEEYVHMRGLPLEVDNDFGSRNTNSQTHVQPMGDWDDYVSDFLRPSGSTNSMQAYMNSILAGQVDTANANQVTTTSGSDLTNSHNATDPANTVTRHDPDAPPQNDNSAPYQKVFEYAGDPLLRHLRYPPMWLEQSYNRSEFALRTPPPGTLPPAPGQDGFGRYNLDGSPVHRVAVPASPDEQLRREQEAALMLSMMGRRDGAAQPQQQAQVRHQHGNVQQALSGGALVQYAQAQQRARRQQMEMQQQAAVDQGVVDAAAMPPGGNNGVVQDQGQGVPRGQVHNGQTH